MNIISFDVGTKNLAMCIINYEEKNNKFKILDWSVKDIFKCFDCETENIQITEINNKIYVKCSSCDNSNQNNAINIPEKMKIIYFLQDFLDKLYIQISNMQIMQNCNLIIEDQPYSKKINRDMIYVQDTIISYFALKNIRVQTVQAKIRSMFYKNSTYKSNKKNSIMSTQQILSQQKSQRVQQQYQFWNEQIKKDDFSDSFLQSIAFIYKNIIKKKLKQKIENIQQILEIITID